MSHPHVNQVYQLGSWGTAGVDEDGYLAWVEVTPNPTPQLMGANMYPQPMSAPGQTEAYALPSTADGYSDGAEFGNGGVPPYPEPCTIPIEQFQHVAQPQNPADALLQMPPASCLFARCRWTDDGVCDVSLDCESVPAHFKHFHGIKNRQDTELLICRWECCSDPVSRKNFARHLRERHLGHHRDRGCSTPHVD